MKKKTGVILSSAAAIAVCASVMAGSTYALFTSESKTDISVSSGSVKVVATVNEDSLKTKQLYDAEWTEGTEGLFGGSVELGEYSLNVENLAAGDAVSFTIDIENVGTINAKYRTVLKSETGLGELDVTIGGESVAYDGATVYSAWDYIAAGETVEGIEVTLELPETAVEQNAVYNLTYIVEAVQGNAVTRDGVAHIGVGDERKDYLTLQAAFDASVAGDTVYIDEDITLNSGITVSKGVTVEGDNHVITITDNTTHCFYANCNNLTLNDLTFNCYTATQSGLTLDGAYMYTLNNVNVYGEARHSLIRFLNSSGGEMNGCTVENSIAPEATLFYAYGMPYATDVFVNRNTRTSSTAAEGGISLQLNNTTLGTLVINSSPINYELPKAYVNDGTNIDYVFYGLTEAPEFSPISINGGTVKTMHLPKAYKANVGLYLDMLQTEEVYVITNANGLSLFADNVNNGNNYAGATVVLANDIDLENKEWTPIGTAATPFSGTFDGNGNTISNLKITNGDANVGLFGYAVSPAKIMNFNIENVDLNGVAQLGAVVGCLFTGTIDNVNVYNVKITSGRRSGGITGLSYGAVTNCTVDGLEIVLTPYMDGGILDNGDKAGGIVGYAPGTKLVGNTVKNAVITAWRDLGGVAGYTNLDNGTHYVTDNYVENVELHYITLEGVETVGGHVNENMGEIIGRKDPITVAERNEAVNVKLYND